MFLVISDVALTQESRNETQREKIAERGQEVIVDTSQAKQSPKNYDPDLNENWN